MNWFAELNTMGKLIQLSFIRAFVFIYLRWRRHSKEITVSWQFYERSLKVAADRPPVPAERHRHQCLPCMDKLSLVRSVVS